MGKMKDLSIPTGESTFKVIYYSEVKQRIIEETIEGQSNLISLLGTIDQFDGLVYQVSYLS